MWLTATKIFLGILLTGILPIKVLAESSASESIDLKQTKFEFLTINDFKVINNEPSAPHIGERYFRRRERSSAYFQSGFAEEAGIGIYTALSDLTVELDDNYSRVIDLYSGNLTQAAFKAGVASWQSKNRLGSWKFDAKFDDSARFTKGKFYLATPTVIGLIDLSIDLNDRLEPIETVTGWYADTLLGSFAVNGNFNEEIVFTGANAIWNAKTKLGTVSIKGNFDRQTNFNGGNAAWNAKTSIAFFGLRGNFDRETKFTGGNFKIGSKALIGSFQADIKIDEESKFDGANASWNTNLLFGSNIGVSGRFDDTNTFAGGKIELGTKSGLGTMGVKAYLDRDTQFTSGSAFWKTKTKLGSINLDADLKKDGNFASKLGWEFPF